jgi:hypothetical protein
MNRFAKRHSQGPLHFPMYVLAHEDLASVISETDKGEEILVLFWAHDQVGEEADEITGARRLSTDKPVRRTVVGARTHGNFT